MMSRGFPLQDTGPGMNELFHDLSVEQEEMRAAERAGYEAYVRNKRAGELCTYGPETERKPIWIVRFEDADRGDAVFHDEDEAVSFFLRVEGSWNCTLLGTVRLPPAKSTNS